MNNRKDIVFNPEKDIVFLFSKSLPFHPNALTFEATLTNNQTISETYYSVGGGFVVKDGESKNGSVNKINLKFPIDTSEELLIYCDRNKSSVSEVVLENE